MNKILLVSFLFFTTISQVSGSSKEDKFDPDDCYEPGTLFEDDERNLGFCPCRYGYYGPTCFEIHDCVIGEIRTENCSRDFKDDFDLQWRCVESGRDAVKICTCPEGFRGETCEYILENTLATWLVSVKQSQKFFDVIYNETDSVVRLFATFLWRKITKYRRLIIIVIFFIILELSWRITKRRCRKQKQKEKEEAEDKNSHGAKILGQCQKTNKVKRNKWLRIFKKNVVYEALQPMDAERMERMEEGNLRNEEKVNSELPLCENVAPPPYEKLEILTANSQEQEEVSIVFKPNIHV